MSVEFSLSTPRRTVPAGTNAHARLGHYIVEANFWVDWGARLIDLDGPDPDAEFSGPEAKQITEAYRQEILTQLREEMDNLVGDGEEDEADEADEADGNED